MYHLECACAWDLVRNDYATVVCSEYILLSSLLQLEGATKTRKIKQRAAAIISDAINTLNHITST
jgi:hypothetical protein